MGKSAEITFFDVDDIRFPSSLKNTGAGAQVCIKNSILCKNIIIILYMQKWTNSSSILQYNIAYSICVCICKL